MKTFKYEWLILFYFLQSKFKCIHATITIYRQIYIHIIIYSHINNSVYSFRVGVRGRLQMTVTVQRDGACYHASYIHVIGARKNRRSNTDCKLSEHIWKSIISLICVPRKFDKACVCAEANEERSEFHMWLRNICKSLCVVLKFFKKKSNYISNSRFFQYWWVESSIYSWNFILTWQTKPPQVNYYQAISDNNGKLNRFIKAWLWCKMSQFWRKGK